MKNDVPCEQLKLRKIRYLFVLIIERKNAAEEFEDNKKGQVTVSLDLFVILLRLLNKADICLQDNQVGNVNEECPNDRYNHESLR